MAYVGKVGELVILRSSCFFPQFFCTSELSTAASVRILENSSVITISDS
jgi:hypothetical protein